MKRQRFLLWLASIILGTVSLMAQQPYTMHGVVQDTGGEPLIGGSVTIKDAKGGVTTDIDGNFAISVKNGDVLVISYVGFIPQEIAVTGQNNITVTLAENTQNLEEVVVIGYGTARKKDLTGAVTQINPDKIADQNPATVSDLLRGTAGLQIGYDASAKGEGASIQLRGQNSLYTEGSHNSPLIVLDGMAFYGELSEINPDDIAQIDVLKDASSAAIYGAKAASGVLIITTKKGKEGKPIINISANMGVAQKAKYLDYMNAAEYMAYREDWYKATTYGYREDGTWGYYAKGTQPEGYFDHYSRVADTDAWAHTGTDVLSSDETFEALYARRLRLTSAQNVYNNFLNGLTTDWNDLTFRTGLRQDYNASISGATPAVNYYFSIGYLKNEGPVQGNDYEAMRASLKLNTKVTNWLEFGVNANFQNRSDGDIQVSLGNSYWDANMLRNSPYASFRKEDGTYEQYPMNGNSTNGGYNYYFERDYYELDKGYTVLNTIFNAKVTLPYGFTYQFNIAPRMQWFHNRYWLSAEKPGSSPSTDNVDREVKHSTDWNLNNTLTWDRTYADVHHITVTLVQEAEENRSWRQRIDANNIQPSDVLGFHFIGNANKEQSSFLSEDLKSTASAYLARAFYGYDDRYMITATFRRDGYSAFGSNDPWANFWSLGGSWRFSQEKFCRFDWLNEGKFRVSYGTNGNRSLSNTYLAMANLLSESTMVYIQNGVPVPVNTLKMDRLANPSLQWEKTSAWNVGLDLSFFNSRLSANIDWYSKRTHDMIMKQRLPNFTGFDHIWTNLGEVTNSGIEISLSSLNINNPDFRWNTTASFSYNKNRIKHLYYDYDENGVERDDTSSGWFIDKPIGEIWYYRTDGIWQADEAEQAALVNQKPGDPKVVNLYTEDDKILEDGTRVPVYNDKDKDYLGTKNPPIYWNLRNEFTFWKDLTFSFSLYSYMGHKSIEGYWLNGDNAGSQISNAFNIPRKPGYWTPDNPTNDYGRLDAVGPTGVTDIKKLYNRNFVRLDNISIGYTLPREWTKKALIDRVRVTAAVNNVCTISGWKYADPETGGLSTRTFNFGINLTL